LAELLELVDQLPELPITLEEDLATWAVEELPLQLYAFATFGVIVGAKIIAKTLAVKMVRAINRVTLFIHVIALSDVLKHSVKLYSL
jgi:hypothetical protein